MPKLWSISLVSTGLPATEALDREFVVAFRFAVNAAVVLCWILNIIWCVGVLWCVPQTVVSDAALAGVIPSPPSAVRTAIMLPFSTLRAAKEASPVSLTSANLNGEISTIPLVEALKARSDNGATYIYSLVNVFVFISISVSMCVMAIGMIHLLDSLADSVVTKYFSPSAINGARAGPGRSSRNVRRAGRLGLSGVAFAIITWISTSNPKALLKIMAGITSLCLNAEGGLLIMIMLITSRVGRIDSPDSIPDPLPRGVTAALVVYVLVFYSFAVLVDIIKYLPRIFA
jgi:hypothetical protein